MRVLMLNPPFLRGFSRSSRSPEISKGGTLYYPYLLAYATGVLEKEHEVKLVDAPARGFSKKKTIKIAESFGPELIVMDTSTPSIYNDVKIAAELREKTGAFITLVGTHVSALPDETLHLSDRVDAIARKEYDYTLLELANALEKGKKLKIAGLSYKKRKKIIHNPDREYIKNLDKLPWVSPVYKKHLRIEDYFYAANLHPVVTILSGRGCPFRCSFCVYSKVMWGHKYRFRSAADVVNELEYIKNEFPNVKEIFFEDDTLTANKKRCRDICDLIIKRKLDITWSCNSRADLDYSTMLKMRRAGCRLLCVGYESGSQRVLNDVRKGTKIDVIKRFALNAKKAGLLVHGCFMLGLPGDTKETIRKTIEFAKELDPDTAQFYPIMVYPGTAAYEWAKNSGYLITEDWSKWLTKEGVHNCVISRPGLTNEELVELCDKALKEFYYRPRKILSIILSTRSMSDLKRKMHGFGSFMRYFFEKKF